MEVNPLSVSSYLELIKTSLENEFRAESILGEISNLSISSAGHIYFTLSDEQASISCVVFKTDALRNTKIRSLKDGDKVECFGSVTIFKKRGTLQIVVKQVVYAGNGDLKSQFEKLKIKLAKDGLFDIAIKKNIPTIPNRVAIITSEKGAALQDFLNIVDRRDACFEVLIFPSLVQGDLAASQLRKALENAIRFSLKERKIDVIVFARGGGSYEDLWCFNDEGLAWDIFNCDIPVISAVGHQVDFTICDYVADQRCETPSAAAEVLTQSMVERKQNLISLKNRILNSMELRLSKTRARVDKFSSKQLSDRIAQAFNHYVVRLGNLRFSSRAQSLMKLDETRLLLDDYMTKIEANLKTKTVMMKSQIDFMYRHLNALAPNAIMKRGYVLISHGDRYIKSIKDYKQIASKQIMNIHFQDGDAVVEKTNE